MNKEFNLIEAIRTILKWKVHILTLTVVAAIAAAIFSVFVMDEYYLSWATFYPTNQAMNDRSIIFSADATQTDYFGGKSDVNRVLTAANSAPLMEYIIDSFHLAQHYDVDTNKKYWHTIIRKKFEKNYAAIKTERDAVEISVYDTDPLMATKIVNAILAKVDAMNKELVNETKRKTQQAIINQIKDLQAQVDGYADTLAVLGQEYKIKVSTGAEGTSIVDGNDYKAVQKYKVILAKQVSATRELNNTISIKSQMDVSLKNNETSLYVVEQAFPADRRSKPVRSLVVLITVLITLFVSIIGVLLIEQIREIKAQL